MNRDEKLLWQLSVEEFVNLLKENGISGSVAQTEEKPTPQVKNYVYGIDGLAKLLNCSKVTAQSIKNNGKIDTCYSQINRKLVFDADKVLKVLQKKGEANEQ